MSRVKGKTRFIVSSYTYLTLGFSNPVGAKFSRWRLGINSFGANGKILCLRDLKIRARGRYTKTWWKEFFLLHGSLFLVSLWSGKEGTITGIYFKILRPTLLLLLEANSLLRCFHSFTLGVNFPRTPDYPGGQGIFFSFWSSSLSLNFEFEI